MLPIAEAQLTCSNLFSSSNAMACIVSSDEKLAKCSKAVAPHLSVLSACCASEKAAPIFVIFIIIIIIILIQSC